jgi:hypothetical protein
MQHAKHNTITVQLIDTAGRSLGRLRLPSNLNIDDLERLAVAAGSPSIASHLEQHLSNAVRAQGVSL